MLVGWYDDAYRRTAERLAVLRVAPSSRLYAGAPDLSGQFFGRVE